MADLEASLRAALSGDEAAFAEVYRAVNPALVRYLRVLVGSEAEDVASEAWLKACKQLGRFSGDLDGFRGWLSVIGRTTALDHLRAAGRRPVSAMDDELLMAVPTRGDASTDALAEIGTQQALDLIKGLPQTQAEAVMLVSVMGLDATAAGKVLGRRGGAVRMALSRGLATLSDRVTPDGPSTLGRT